MSQDDFPQRFERAYVALVTERAALRGYKKGEFAAKLWPWMKPKVAAIREKAVHTGKPQSVTIADALRMADALGEDVGYLMVIAKENVRKEFSGVGKKEK